MRIILFIIFTTFYCTAQVENNTYEFKFYKNGYYRNTKKIKIYIIKDSDTLKCDILKNQITIPKIFTQCSVVVQDKKAIYKIEDVDFSKLEEQMLICLGIEKNYVNFQPTELTNVYFHPYSGSPVKIENFHDSKKVVFLNFKTSVTMELSKLYKTYSRSITE